VGAAGDAAGSSWDVEEDKYARHLLIDFATG